VYEAGNILALMGVEDNYYDYRDEERDDEDTTTFKSFYYYAQNENQQAVSVSGFDYSCNFSTYFSESESYSNNYYQIHFGNDSGFVKYSKDKKDFIFTKNGKDILSFNMDEFLKKISDYNKGHKKHQYDQNIPKNMMLYEAQNDSVRIKLFVANIQGTRSKSETKVSQIGGMLLLEIGSAKIK
jgi:hypothetical protein